MSRNSDNTLIYYPVNTWDVAKVTRKGSGDVGVLCGSNQMINKWAKYKPVILPNVIDSTVINGVQQLNTSTKQWLSTATWWKAADGKCGFTIEKRTTGSALVTNWGTDWTYNPPTGGMAAPFRLIDFNYYDHAAVNPVGVYYPTSYVRNQGNDLNVQFTVYHGNDYRLLLTDVTAGIWNSQASMYCGVLVVAGIQNTSYTNRSKIAVVNPTALGTGNTDAEKYNRTVSVPSSIMDNFNVGVEIQIYPFLCQNAYATQQKGANEDVGWEYGVVACPFDMTTIYVVQAWLSGALSNVTCTYGAAGNSVQLAFNYVITGHNGFSENNLTAYLYVLDNDIDTSGQYPDSEKKDGHHIIEAQGNNPFMGQSFGSITLADGATMSFDQTTLMSNTTGNFVAGIDAASYVADYRSRHGSSVKALVTLIVEFHDNSTGIYGSTTMSNVEISGTY